MERLLKESGVERIEGHSTQIDFWKKMGDQIKDSTSNIIKNLVQGADQ